tara:strand:+ start:224 stop:820 length:597 start_codon:yes stop_codon:yes gene_type:complete
LEVFQIIPPLQTYDTGKLEIESYYSQNNIGNPEIISFNNCEEGVGQVMSQGDSMELLFISMKNDGKINQMQLDFLLTINSILLNAKSVNNVAESLFQLEQEIEANGTLSFNEKAMVFGASIVGRNSSYYWYDANTDPSSPWQELPIPVQGKAKWWVRGLRDLAGFVVGYAVGSLISLGNPIVGTAAGTLVGTAASAAD